MTLINDIANHLPDNIQTGEPEIAKSFANEVLRVLVYMVNEEDARRFMTETDVPAEGLDVRTFRLYQPHKNGILAGLFPPQAYHAIVTGSHNGLYQVSEVMPGAVIKDGKLYIFPDGGKLSAFGVTPIDDIESSDITNMPQPFRSAVVYYTAVQLLRNRIFDLSDISAISGFDPIDLDADFPSLTIDTFSDTITLVSSPGLLSVDYSPDIVNLVTVGYPDGPTLSFGVSEPSLESYPAPLTLAQDNTSLTLKAYPLELSLSAESSDLSLVDFPAPLGSLKYDPDAVDFPELDLDNLPTAPTDPTISSDEASEPSFSAPDIDSTKPDFDGGDIYNKEDVTLNFTDLDARDSDDDIEMFNGQIQKLRTELEKANTRMNDELNRVNQKIQKFQSDVQHSIEQGRMTLQADQGLAELKVSTELNNAQNKLQAAIEEKRLLIQKYNTEVNAITAQNQNLISEFAQKIESLGLADNLIRQKFDSNVRAISEENQTKIAEFQAQVNRFFTYQQNQITDYQSRVQAVASENQGLLAEYQADIQKILNENQTAIADWQAQVQQIGQLNNERIALFQNQVQELSAKNQQQIEEFLALVQKADSANQTIITEWMQKEQALFNKQQTEIAAYQANISNITQENQSVLSEYQLKLQAWSEAQQLEALRFQNEVQFVLSKYQADLQIKLSEKQLSLNVSMNNVQISAEKIQVYFSVIMKLVNQFNSAVQAYMMAMQRESHIPAPVDPEVPA